MITIVDRRGWTLSAKRDAFDKGWITAHRAPVGDYVKKMWWGDDGDVLRLRLDGRPIGRAILKNPIPPPPPPRDPKAMRRWLAERAK